MTLIQKIRSVIKKFFAEVLLDDLARGKIELKSLSPRMRHYVIYCLLIVYIILVCTIYLYFHDSSFLGVTFFYNDAIYNISLLTLGVSLVAFIFGWTFLLIGGIWSNIFIFTALSFLFIYFAGYIGLAFAKPCWIFLLLGFTAMLTALSFKRSTYIPTILRYICLSIICFGISFLGIFITPIKHFIKPDYIWWAVFASTILLSLLISRISSFKKWLFPEEKFIFIGRITLVSLIIIFIGLFFLRSFKIGQFTELLFTVFERTLAYISLFWFVLGFSALWGVINLSEWTRDALEILFPKKIIFAIVLIFWICIIFLNIYPVELPYIWTFSLKWTNLAIILFMILLLRRFNVSRILTLFQFTIFVLLLSHAYYVISSETVKDPEFRWDSFIMFIIGITWLLFQGSGIIINSSSRYFPRNSRLFLFFGLIFLMLGLNIFMLVTRYKIFMDEVKLSAFIGFLYTGPPFILYLWLVKRFKRHPVRPSQLAYLFIWGALLVHPFLLLQKAFCICGINIILLVIILSIIEEYLKLFIIRWLTYRSTDFNEKIDGIIYASAIGLGWIVFKLNPQFNLSPIPIYFARDISPYPINSALLWHFFSLQFACAGLLGYGLAKAKMSGIPYKQAEVFLNKPIFLGFTSAILYRGIMDMIFNIYTKQIFATGIIWGLTGISLIIAVITIRRALIPPVTERGS